MKVCGFPLQEGQRKSCRGEAGLLLHLLFVEKKSEPRGLRDVLNLASIVPRVMRCTCLTEITVSTGFSMNGGLVVRFSFCF